MLQHYHMKCQKCRLWQCIRKISFVHYCIIQIRLFSLSKLDIHCIQTY